MKLETVGSNQTLLKFSDGREIFFSYSTPVAGFLPGVGYFSTDWKYSRTTSKHITQYLKGLTAVPASPAEIQSILDGTHNGKRV